MASKGGPAGGPSKDPRSELGLRAPGDPATEGGEEGTGEIKGEPRTFQQKAAAHNLNVAQYQVEEVIDIMRENVEKVLERDGKLGELEERAETLYDGASAFQKSAGSLKNKMWLANLKQTIIMVVIGLVLVLLMAKYFDFI